MADSDAGTRRGLLVATAFPPMTEPEAILIAKRLGNLPGWTIDAVVPAPFSGTGDPQTAAYAGRRFNRVERIAVPWLCRVPPRILGPVQQLPDQLRWAKGRLVGRALALGLGNYDALISCSQWHSSHLAAHALKRYRPDLPWIAQFSDPWVRNPYNRYVWPIRWINARMERGVLNAADALVFTTAEISDLVLEDAPAAWRAKAQILPHAFDPALYPTSDRVGGSTIVVRHIGHFYGTRSPRPLFAALQRIAERAPLLLDDVAVELIGSVSPRALSDVPATGLPPSLIRLVPPVDYCRSLAMMREADLLVAVDAPAERSVFLPSKLVDYIGAGRPVLAITPPGAAASVIDAVGGWRADPRDPAAVATALEQALRYVRAHRGAPFGAGPVRDRYHVRNVGAQFAAILDACVRTVAA